MADFAVWQTHVEAADAHAAQHVQQHAQAEPGAAPGPWLQDFRQLRREPVARQEALEVGLALQIGFTHFKTPHSKLGTRDSADRGARRRRLALEHAAAQPDLQSLPGLGRASCRESVCPYVYIAVVAGLLKNKT